MVVAAGYISSSAVYVPHIVDYTLKYAKVCVKLDFLSVLVSGSLEKKKKKNLFQGPNHTQNSMLDKIPHSPPTSDVIITVHNTTTRGLPVCQ